MMWTRDKTISVLGSVVLLLLLLQPASGAPGHCVHNYYNCKYGDSNQEVRIITTRSTMTVPFVQLSREGRNVLNGGRNTDSSIFLTVISVILTATTALKC